MALDARKFRLVAIRYLADAISMFELAPLDGGALPRFTAGAHINVSLPNGLVRAYSLCNAPDDTEHYHIAVKCEARGRGGSAYIHDSLRVGTILEVSEPANYFELEEQAIHTVLLAGGIGITPLVCMAERLEALGQSYELHYCIRTRSEAMFLERMPKVQLHVDDERVGGGYLDVAALVDKAPADAHLYCCGPTPMMDAFVAASQARAPQYVHLERFSAEVDAATEGGFSVELAKTGRTVRVQSGETILDAVRACGVQVRASCQQGICGACETRVIAGLPDHRDTLLSDEEKAANDVIMICCSGSLSERLVLDL